MQDLGYSVSDDGSLIPTVVLDVADHPGIADLARVHAVEGVGDLTTTGRRVAQAGPNGEDLFLLGVAMTSPVRATFAIAFPLPDAHEFLGHAADTGRLALATTPPDAVGHDRPVWLAIDLDRSALRASFD